MNYSFELNNARNDATFASGKVRDTSLVVKVFEAMASGKEVGSVKDRKENLDAAVKYIKTLGAKASVNDITAISELNEIRKFVMSPKLLQEIKLLSVFGSYKPLGWNDTAYLEKITYENVRADIQAEGQDVSTAFSRKSKIPLAPITISGGYKSDYREVELGDMSTENTLMEEVRKEIRNKATMYVLETVFKAVENATGVKYFYENAGLAKTSVDALLTKIRRYGKPNVHGDYALLAQFLPWIGYAGTVGSNTITGVSQKLLDEIADTGIIGSYNGSVLVEIPNGYNFSKIVTDGEGTKNYDVLLPAGLGIVTPAAPANGIAPVQNFSIGGLTSFSGNSVSTGEIMTRFDLKIASGVASPECIAIIHDTNLDQL